MSYFTQLPVSVDRATRGKRSVDIGKSARPTVGVSNIFPPSVRCDKPQNHQGHVLAEVKSGCRQT